MSGRGDPGAERVAAPVPTAGEWQAAPTAQAAGSTELTMQDLKAFFYHFFRATHLVRYILGGLTLMLLCISVVIWRVEEASFADALYLTLITGLTVGYGDISPTTWSGRIASIVAALVGLIISGIYVALATNAVQRSLSEHHRTNQEGRADGRRTPESVPSDGHGA
jgi:voltage-gated potassium channel